MLALSVRVGFVLSITLALPSLLNADATITFLDLTDTVTTSLGPCKVNANPETCIYEGFKGLTEGGTLAVNIYEPDLVTLSDTLQVTSDGTITFLSDTEGGAALVPLVGATTMTENGFQQEAGTVLLVHDLGTLHVDFESDVEPVPEPRWTVLLMLGVLGIAAFVAKHRRPSER